MKVLVIGDVMIDSYMWGSVSRKSPEADVPVVDVNRREMRLGGAGNVALNLKSLGCKVGLLGILGADHYQERYLNLFKEAHLSNEFMLLLENRINTVKTRIIDKNSHVLRIDEEEVKYLDLQEEEIVLSHINECLKKRWDLIIFEDYNKGLLTEKLIETVISRATELGIPTVVDPKKNFIEAYAGADLFKPNLKELYWALDKKQGHFNVDEVSNLAEKFRTKHHFKSLLVTLSEHGMLVLDNTSSHLIPAFERNIVDVSGAGDTVVSVAGTALAAGLDAESICLLANLAGGLVCEESGVVPINLTALIAEAKKHCNEH